ATACSAGSITTNDSACDTAASAATANGCNSTSNAGKHSRRIMLANGQAAVIRMAIRDLNHPLLDRYQPAVLLGAMRADVWYAPFVGKVIEHLSFSHFYRRNLPGGFLPFITRGTRTMARTWFNDAIAAQRKGDHAAAFVRLGEVSHLIADMSCPVHVHRVIHESDPFEWYVEAHHAELR